MIKFSNLTLNHFPLFMSLFITLPGVKATHIQGLHNRFPEAWEKREHYPFFKRFLFNQLPLEEEAIHKLTYCLCEHAMETPELFQAIRELIIRFSDKKHSNRVKDLLEKGKFRTDFQTYAEEFFITHLKTFPCSYFIPFFSIEMGFFLEQKGMTFSDEKARLFEELWNQQTEQLLNDYGINGTIHQHSFDLSHIIQHLHNPRHPLQRKALNYLKTYESTLDQGQSIHQALESLFRERPSFYHSDFNHFLLFAMDHFRLSSDNQIRIQTELILEAMTYLLCFHQMKQHLNHQLNHLSKLSQLEEKEEHQKQSQLIQNELEEKMSELIKNKKLSLKERQRQEKKLFQDFLLTKLSLLQPVEIYDYWDANRYLPHDLFETFNEEIKELFDQYLPFVYLLLQMGKTHDENRRLFYQYYHPNHSSITKKLEHELKTTQQALTQEQHHVQQLKNQIQTLKESHQSELQRRLKSQQDALLQSERENQQLQKEIEDLKQLLKQQKAKNHPSNDGVSLIKDNHSLTNPHLNEGVDDELDLLLNQANLLIIGGYPVTINRLKERLPNCKYYECDMTFKDQFFQGIEHAFIMKNYVNHGMVYKVRKVCPDIPFYEIDATNPDRILLQIKEQLKQRHTS